MMKNLLDRTHNMNSTNVNAGGWRDSEMRTWLNTRVYNGLPDQWKLLLKKVHVISMAGDMSKEYVNSEDYIWIPATKEVGLQVNTPPYSMESEGTINLFTNDASRVKRKNGVGDPIYWWLRSPYAGSATAFSIVITTGSFTGNNAGNGFGVCFGFCI